MVCGVKRNQGAHQWEGIPEKEALGVLAQWLEKAAVFKDEGEAWPPKFLHCYGNSVSRLEG